jgi:hypothetical protein
VFYAGMPLKQTRWPLPCEFAPCGTPKHSQQRLEHTERVKLENSIEYSWQRGCSFEVRIVYKGET